MELKGKIIPKDLDKRLFEIRDRVREIQKTYGSLARWGRPFLFDKEEERGDSCQNHQYSDRACN